MASGRGKDVVLVSALLAALLHGGLLVLRARGVIGSQWTDGRQRLATDAGDLRRSVWDEPVALDGLGCTARDPALAPDGRLLVLVVGERGRNAELYASTLVAGVPGRAEPLTALNTSADELAPAFAADALYFASDRPGGAGGLDLWRAPYSGGEFGAVEHLDGDWSSPTDDTDPAPLASGALVFASDRAGAPGHHDLFQGELVGDVRGVAPLDDLNTPFEEREPCVDPDDLALYFASDRPGSGGFGLLRSLRMDGRWLAPAPLRTLDGPGDERGPWVSADGSRLWFEGRDPDGAPRILGARSRELYLVPAPPASVGERIVLAGLVLVAASALLARLWRVLHVAHRALLASLALHVALLVAMGRTYTGGTGGARLDLEEGGHETHRIQIARVEDDGVRSELQGPHEPATREGPDQDGALQAEALASIAASLAASLPPPEASAPVDAVSVEVSRAVSPMESAAGPPPPSVVARAEPAETDAPPTGPVATTVAQEPAASAPPAAAANDEQDEPGGAPPAAPPPPELGTPEGTLAAPTPVLQPATREPARASESVPIATPEPRAATVRDAEPPAPEAPTLSPVAGVGAPPPSMPEGAPRAGAAESTPATSDAGDAARKMAELMRDPALLAAAGTELSGEERRGFATVLLAHPEEQLAIARFFGEELVLVPRATLDPAATDPHWFRVVPETGDVEELRGHPPLERFRQYRDLFDYEYARLPAELRSLRRTLAARGDIYLFAALVPAREWAVVVARRAEALAGAHRGLADVRRVVLRYRELADGAFDLAVDHVEFVDGSRYPSIGGTHGAPGHGEGDRAR